MGQLSAIAMSQLEAWEAVAKRWMLNPQILVTVQGHRDGPGLEQLHLTCGGYGISDTGPAAGCNQTIWMIHDGHDYITFHNSDLLAATVAHIRNVHRNMEEDVYAQVPNLR